MLRVNFGRMFIQPLLYIMIGAVGFTIGSGAFSGRFLPLIFHFHISET